MEIFWQQLFPALQHSKSFSAMHTRNVTGILLTERE